MNQQSAFPQKFLLAMTLVNLVSSVLALLMFCALERSGQASLLLATGLLLSGMWPLARYLNARKRPSYALPMGV